MQAAAGLLVQSVGDSRDDLPGPRELHLSRTPVASQMQKNFVDFSNMAEVGWTDRLDIHQGTTQNLL